MGNLETASVSDDRPTSIYGLRDPVTREIRYVGRSIDPKTRRTNHVYNARTGKDDTYHSRWINTLLAQGLEPELVILENVAIGGNWAAAEQAWVAYVRSYLGDRLTNHTDGGDGTSIVRIPEQVRAKVSAAKIGKPKSDETRARMSEAQKRAWENPDRKPTPEEAFARGAATRTGRKHSPEWCANITAGKLASPNVRRGKGSGTPCTEETKAKLSAARKGKPLSEEHKAKLSAAKKGKPLSPAAMEVVQRNAEQRRGTTVSDETRARLRVAATKREAKKRAEREAAKAAA